MHCVCCSIIAWDVECTKKSQPEIMFRKHIKKSKDWIRCFRIKHFALTIDQQSMIWIGEVLCTHKVP